MVQLPFSALRRHASPANGVLFQGCSPSCSKVDAAVEVLSQQKQSGFPRQQIANLAEAFIVEKVLGSGGFGIVQKASLRAGGPASAVKTIAKSGHAVEAMANCEIKILQRLAHSNICTLHSVYEDPDCIHLALEYVQGHELFEEITPEMPMKETRASSIMKQVFEALQYCHRLQPAIIHRDLKPENIMITDVAFDMPQVKIIDWGLAAECCDTIQTPVVGTPCYMSPEALSVGMYSRASDMWSAGAILYMLLTGGEIPPQFKPLSVSNGAQARLFHELGTSSSAQDILNGLLKRNPDQRLTASCAAAHPWTMTTGVVAPTPASSTDQDENAAPFSHLERIQRTALSAAMPLCVEGQLLRGTTPGDCIKLGADASSRMPTLEQKLSVSCVDFEIGLGTDFQIFDEFAQAASSPSAKTKKHRHCKVHDTAKSSHASAKNSKENLGPGAPRVCKHTQMPARHPLKCAATGDCARKTPLPSRAMR